jgi:hypothetical protein
MDEAERGLAEIAIKLIKSMPDGALIGQIEMMRAELENRGYKIILAIEGGKNG